MYSHAVPGPRGAYGGGLRLTRGGVAERNSSCVWHRSSGFLICGQSSDTVPKTRAQTHRLSEIVALGNLVGGLVFAVNNLSRLLLP